MTDNSKTYTSVIDSSVCDNSKYGYFDVNIYVTCPDGSEWRLTVSMDAADGSVWDSVICFAADGLDFFDEAENLPPAGVSSLFGELRPKATAMLRAAYAKGSKAEEDAA